MIPFARSPFRLAAAALLAAALPAQQVTVTATAVDPLGVYARAPGVAADAQVVPAGTPLAAGFALAATSGSSFASADLELGAASARYTVRGHAETTLAPAADAGTCIDATPTPGAHRLQLQFVASTTLSGKLIAVLSGSHVESVPGAAQASIAVAIGGAGGGGWSTPRTLPLRVEKLATLDPAGTAVDVTVSGLAQGTEGEAFEAVVDVFFQPDPIVTPYGAACATANGSGSTRLRIEVQSTVLLGQAALLLGTQPAQRFSGFPGCPLLVDTALVLTGYRTGIDGKANISLPLPRGPLQFQVQAVVADLAAPKVELTNGLDVVVLSFAP